MVCITSSDGLMSFCKRSQRLMAIPMGKPTTRATKVHTKIMEMVFMVSSHMPKNPINSRVTTVPTTIFQEREASQATRAITPTTAGQGDWVSRRSENSKKSRRGSNKRSSGSPYSRVKLRKLPSMARRMALSVSDPSEGNSLSQDMVSPWAEKRISGTAP